MADTAAPLRARAPVYGGELLCDGDGRWRVVLAFLDGTRRVLTSPWFETRRECFCALDIVLGAVEMSERLPAHWQASGWHWS